MSGQVLSKAELEADRAQAKEDKSTNGKKRLTLSLTSKGCVAIKGIRKFPVAFYKDEWDLLIKTIRSGELESFMDDMGMKAKFKPKKKTDPK